METSSGLGLIVPFPFCRVSVFKGDTVSKVTSLLCIDDQGARAQVGVDPGFDVGK